MNMLILFVLIFASTAEAMDYYVSKQGTDTYNCTLARILATPKLTIASGASCLKAGDTLFVMAGVYAEELSNIIPSGTSSAPVTVTPYAGDIVTIQPPSGANTALTLSGANRAYIVIDRINIDCVNASARCVNIQQGAHHIKIKNAEVKNSPGIGVTGGVNSEFNTLNVHHHKGGAFNLDQSNNVIMQTVIHDNAGNGIVVIANAANTRIYNNTIINNSGDAIVVGPNVNGTMVKNNIVRGRITDQGAGTIMTNNQVIP